MISFKKILLPTALLLALSGCQVKLYDFNPNQDSVKLAVEGFVSDSTGYHFVRLTKSVNVLSTEPNPLISNAIVIVKDNENLIDTFQYSAQTGLYLSSKFPQWKGKPGNTYTLSVVTPEFNVTASEAMPNYENFKIDSLRPVFREKATANRVRNFSYNDVFFTGQKYINVDDSVFRIRIFALKQLPYRVNVQMYAFRNTKPFLNNDRFFVNNLAEVPIDNFFIMPPPGGGPPTNLHFITGDTVNVLLHGITEQCFVYYQGLNSVLGNDGGLFSAPAGNPPSNLSSTAAIGYFKVARVTQKSVLVKFNGDIDD
ncbi:MAG: DUF4249 family protein [Cytophagales bacterium]